MLLHMVQCVHPAEEQELSIASSKPASNSYSQLQDGIAYK
jgi:hypothetical protein